MFGFTFSNRTTRGERGCAFCASKTSGFNTVSVVGHALDVCLILVYALNIILVLRRLITRLNTEFSADSAE